MEKIGKQKAFKGEKILNIYKATKGALKKGCSIARKGNGFDYKIHIIPTNTGEKCIRVERKEIIPRWYPKADDLVGNDWIILDGKKHCELQLPKRLRKVKGMSICEAVEIALKVGGCITRDNKWWKGLIIKPTNTEDCCILKTVAEGLTSARWVPEAEDLTAKDWVIVMGQNAIKILPKN